MVERGVGISREDEVLLTANVTMGQGMKENMCRRMGLNRSVIVSIFIEM